MSAAESSLVRFMPERAIFYSRPDISRAKMSRDALTTTGAPGTAPASPVRVLPGGMGTDIGRQGVAA
jgi:hypothetical protein